MSHTASRVKLPHGNENRDGACRMALLGCPGVGKSALVVRYLTRRFIGEYCPTLESVYKYQTVIDEDEVRLEILDTAGQGREYWKDGYALWADCFIFVYSITDRTSFKDALQLKRQVENVRRSGYITGVLVANKNDLVHDRQVTEAEGEGAAQGLGCSFTELSASDGCQVDGVACMFQDLYRDFRRTRQLRDSRHRKSSSSAKFKQAILQVISGKSPGRRTGPS